MAENYQFIKNSRELRKEMIDEYGYYFCQNCGKTVKSVESHHLIFRSEKPNHEKLNDKINLILLCFECHFDIHKYKNLRIPIVIERKLNGIFGNDVLNNRHLDDLF